MPFRGCGADVLGKQEIAVRCLYTILAVLGKLGKIKKIIIIPQNSLDSPNC
jgi:hypothetical protein